MNLEPLTTLVVLAGGKGTRLGADKSRIRIDGKPILLHLLNRARWAGPTLLVKPLADSVVAGEAAFGQVVADQFPGEGPLGGVVTALHHVESDRLVILPIDLPLIGRVHLLELLASSLDDEIACFSRSDAAGKRVMEPFPLMIKGNARPRISEQFQSGARSMRSLFGAETNRVIHCPAAWPESDWINLNHPADLDRLNASIAD
jgi:molybdenum cofactor guanylyltransferase